LRIEPNSSAAHFNLGLLMAEQGRKAEAEAALRAAIKADPNAAEAMGNLGVLVAEDNLDEAIVLCRRAAELRPGEPKHAYTCAFFVYRKGDRDAAAQVLRELIRRHPAYADAYALLGTICAEQGRQDEARELEARLQAMQPQ
jgi:tetratricopeptide (TPR) repeat protein